MRSNEWQTLGTGNIVGNLRADFRRAEKSVTVVGPWIDAHFAEIVVDSLPKGRSLRIVTRPTSCVSPAFAEHAIAARSTFASRNAEIRLLANLHAKLVVIDESVIYCGSANWYRYSLEASREVVLRGLAANAPGFLDEVQIIWDQAKLDDTAAGTANTALCSGFKEELLDPVASAKLRDVPGSFMLSRPIRNPR